MTLKRCIAGTLLLVAASASACSAKAHADLVTLSHFRGDSAAVYLRSDSLEVALLAPGFVYWSDLKHCPQLTGNVRVTVDGVPMMTTAAGGAYNAALDPSKSDLREQSGGFFRVPDVGGGSGGSSGCEPIQFFLALSALPASSRTATNGAVTEIRLEDDTATIVLRAPALFVPSSLAVAEPSDAVLHRGKMAALAVSDLAPEPKLTVRIRHDNASAPATLLGDRISFVVPPDAPLGSGTLALEANGQPVSPTPAITCDGIATCALNKGDGRYFPEVAITVAE